MSRRKPLSPLRAARERKGYSREWVAGRLDPPVSSKTIERWEEHPEKVKGYRIEQLAELYDAPDLLRAAA
jgi:DNA-binding XRE family transcriptional regulator